MEEFGWLVDSRWLALHHVHHPGKPDGVLTTKVIQSRSPYGRGELVKTSRHLGLSQWFPRFCATR